MASKPHASFSPVAGVSGEDAQYLGSLISTVPGFPSEGILFSDSWPVCLPAGYAHPC